MERRIILFFLLSFMIILAYQKMYMPPPPAAPPGEKQGATGAATTTTSTLTALPTATPAPTPFPVAPRETVQTPAPKLTLRTQTHEIVFSTRGAVPVQWDIIDPRFVPPAGHNGKDEQAARDERRERLIDPAIETHPQVPRPFQTVLQEMGSGFQNEFNNDIYIATALMDEGTTVGFRFVSPLSRAGLRMVKTYRMDPRGFTGRLSVDLVNESQNNLVFEMDPKGLGITLGPGLGRYEASKGFLQQLTKPDVVFKTPDHFEYEWNNKLEAPGDGKPAEPVSTERSGITWGGIENLYFAMTLIAPPGSSFGAARALIDNSTAELAKSHLTGGNGKELMKIERFYPSLELYTAPFRLDPGQTKSFSFTIYAGPKERHTLLAAGHDLGRLLFHNSWEWFRAMCLGLMWLLGWMHRIFANWGVAIIMLTIVVRLLAFPLVHMGMKSQARMVAEQRRLKPLLDKINEKFKEDPQRRQQETFKLYREHGVNPLASLKGCAWMLVQIPVFVALYRLLLQSIDLRGASFLWVQDLSQPDRLFMLPFSLPLLGNEFNLLPIITALTQAITSKFSATPAADPQQEQMQKMMIYFMPVVILLMTYSFPAGLWLYWLVSNMWQILQQAWVNKHIKGPRTPTAPARA